MIKIIFMALVLILSPQLKADSADQVAIKQIIAEIKYGWENGDGKPFRKNFHDFKALVTLSPVDKMLV